MSKALVVLSGGQDSTTCLAWARQNFGEVHAVTFDYGQRHARELDAALIVAQMLGAASHEIVKVGPILAGRSFLTDHSAQIETFANFDVMSRTNAGKADKLDSSFVPMRNAFFLTLAANRAAVLGCDALVTGVTAADFVEYGEFSWEWLGGFVDAEGCFSAVNDGAPRLSLSQKDPELLRRLGDWIVEQFPGVTYSTHYRANGSEAYFGVKALRALLPSLAPHLHSPHRRSQIERFGLLDLAPEAAITDAYVTGFWEGDGSCNGQFVPTRQAREDGGEETTRQFRFEFFQKDPEVLGAIQEHIGGTLYRRKTQNCIWVLTKSDGPLSAKLLARMRPHMNVLGSFEKIAHARHKVALNAVGFNPPYPDCTPDFIMRQEQMINEALLSPSTKPLKIETPLMFMTKAESVRLAKSLPGCWEAMAHSHTAYSGEYPPLTQDHATVLRAKGFEDAGEPDPLIVRAISEGLMQVPPTPNYAAIRAAHMGAELAQH